MPKAIDLTGQMVGKLEVISLLPVRQDNCRLWFCFCHACGRHTIRKRPTLTDKKTKACGCLQGGAPDLRGQRFERLVVIQRVENDNRGNSRWLCRCSCGNQLCVLAGNLMSHTTKSCGCFRRERARVLRLTHGKTGSGAHQSWGAMLARCSNPNSTAYKNYGGRGIRIEDERWLEFENFYADLGDRPDGTSIDRIDNDLGYFKENCRWATPKEQASNRRPAKKRKAKA